MLSKYISNSNTNRAPTYSKLILWKCAVICTPVSHTMQTSVISFTPLVYLPCVELLWLKSTYDAYFQLKFWEPLLSLTNAAQIKFVKYQCTPNSLELKWVTLKIKYTYKHDIPFVHLILCNLGTEFITKQVITEISVMLQRTGIHEI